jgi:LPS export ABC transporter protein LptC
MMIRKKRRWVVLAAVAALLATALILWLSLREGPEKALMKMMADQVDLQVNDVRLTEVGDGDMKWEIVAETARYQKKENLVLLEVVQVNLVTKDGATYVLNGDRGRLNTATKDMEVEGHVVILSPQGDRLTTDRLRYRNDQQTVHTEDAVQIEGKKVQVRGVGMVYALNEKKISLLSQVQATAREGLGGRP